MSQMDRVCFLLKVSTKGQGRSLSRTLLCQKHEREGNEVRFQVLILLKIRKRHSWLASVCVSWALSHFVFLMMSLSSPLSRWGKASTEANDHCSGRCRCSVVGGEARNKEHQEAMFRAQSSLVWLFPATLPAGESIWPAGWYHASRRRAAALAYPGRDAASTSS